MQYIDNEVTARGRLAVSMAMMLRGVLLTLVCVLPIRMAAQNTWNQSTACPGWNNPSSFTAGNSSCYFQGALGEAKNEAPNVKTGKTGMNFTSTVAAGNLATKTISTSGDCAAFPDATNKAFAIMTTESKCTGYTANRDPNTGSNADAQMKYVPTDFNAPDTVTPEFSTALTKSIRIGDACGGGNATGLYYYMYVEPKNAMMVIYYSCVIQNGGHSVSDDPAFIIRVMQKGSDNKWNQVSDTLAYMVSSTTKQNGGTVEDGKEGWHHHYSNAGSGYGSIDLYYKEWSKVVLNLSKLLYEDIRIEVLISDCPYSQHFAYAYICGECRPMSLTSGGCPAGMSTDVTSLRAPRGLDKYEWSASDYGVGTLTNVNDCEPGKNYSYYTFTDLDNEALDTIGEGYTYNVQASDFKITKRGPSAAQTVTVDSIGNRQIFRCRMTSSLDPAKPIISNLYTIVQNTKPTMQIDTMSFCGGDVRLRNLSYVPGDPNHVDMPATTWMFYNNPQCLGASDTIITGDSAWVHFDVGDMQGVKVRTYTIDQETEECYSEAIYPIRPLPNPVSRMTLSKKVLCDDEAVTLKDISDNSAWRDWLLRGEAEDSPVDPTVKVRKTGDDKTLTRSFTHSVEPVGLTVYNGLFYIDPATEGDTVWCQNTSYDTVAVFLHPELEVLGDTIVCQGSKTDATVRAVGVEGCTYEWSLSNGSITGDLPAGNRLQVTPYAEKATYYVRVTSPQGCVAWDSIHCYLVVPQLAMQPADGRICPGEVVTLIGSHADHYSWTASPEDATLYAQDTMQTVRVMPQKTTVYTMTGHGANGCDATPLTKTVTVYPYPVSKVELSPNIVDSDDPVVKLRDASTYGVASTWTFHGNEVVEGKEVTHTFNEATGADSVSVMLHTVNELGCESIYPFSIPVSLFTSWFPNVFTPGSEDANSRFRLITINEYEYFHIYVYNRGGQLVFDSSDPAFEWDGTYDGEPLPQGTYVYVCRFRKPGTNNVNQLHGAITLLR